MTKRIRLISVIISIVLLCSLLIGGGTYLVIREINKSTATTQTADTTIGNLYNTDGTINVANVSAFLTKIGYYSGAANTTQDSQQIASRLGSGTSYVFKMGYYANTSNQIDSTHRELEWEAVYLRDGYLTIWLTRPYTISLFNASGTTHSNLSTTYSPFAGYTTRPSTYGYYSNYSYSTLRDSTLNIWEAMSSSHDGLSSFIVPPSTSAISAWQSNQNDTYYSSSRYMHHNGLGTYSGSYSWGSGTGTTWRSCLTDMFWIPSAFEVLNDQTGSGNASTTEGGLWNIDSNAFNGTRYDTGAVLSGYSDYCWLRSGSSNNVSSAMQVNSSGTATYDYVDVSYGVRPAAHISLTSLAALAGSEISASVASAAHGSAQVSDDMYTEGDAPVTVTFTSNNNYYISSVTINGASATISASAPSGSSGWTSIDNGACEYRAYRSAANIVLVELRNCTENINVIGTGGRTMNITTSGGNVTVNADTGYTRATYDTTTATITGTTTATYTPQFTYEGNMLLLTGTNNGSSALQIPNTTVTYTYTRSGTNNTNFSLTLYGLPTGINNIPSIQFSATNQVTITFNIDSNSATLGTISHSTGNFDIGSTLTVYAAPKEECAFLYWEDESGQRYSNPLVVNVSAPKTYTAYFASNVLEDIAVVAEYGGSAEIVGEDFDNLQPTDEITLVSRVKITGYRFVGWYDGETLLGTSASIRLPYSQVQGKLITARFEPISNSNINDDTDTDNDFA